MRAVITLTTDFGLEDGYVAAMKGVMLGINPEAELIDISHNILSHDVQEAAFVFGTAYKYFPDKTVHVVVVDPGVGSIRRAIILKTPHAFFVAPDNGVLSYVVQDALNKELSDSQAHLGKSLQAFAITNPVYWQSPVSKTFHGRDIFAPVAARISLGAPPELFGEELGSVTVLPLRGVTRSEDGTISGRIQHIDKFGNLITNISRKDIPDFQITAIVGDKTIAGLSGSYAEKAGLIALIGSSDYLEIAVREGSAQALLKAKVGDEVKVRPVVK